MKSLASLCVVYWRLSFSTSKMPLLLVTSVVCQYENFLIWHHWHSLPKCLKWNLWLSQCYASAWGFLLKPLFSRTLCISDLCFEKSFSATATLFEIVCLVLWRLLCLGLSGVIFSYRGLPMLSWTLKDLFFADTLTALAEHSGSGFAINVTDGIIGQ